MGLLNEEAKESFVLSSRNEEVPAAHSVIGRGRGFTGSLLQGGQGAEPGRAAPRGSRSRCLRPSRLCARPCRHLGGSVVCSTSADVQERPF